ncbi:MAG: helix-turn-helix domain-containing protein [Anaerolineales bacterium]|nr:helix-turn-helix domain-containing protein [Anaerolineales bacterium]
MSERDDLLAQIASQYYEENLTQFEIAQSMGTSRSTVSRLLRAARDAGIVEITIHYPWKTDSQLEQDLINRFNLQHVEVLAGDGRKYEEILRGIGVLAARYLERTLVSDVILGISWGTAIHSTVQALRPKEIQRITVVQMLGAVGTEDPLIDGPDLARRLGSIFGGEHRYLHAPLYVENEQLREALLQEPTIEETLSLAQRADIAVVGIGSLDPDFSSLLRAGFLDRNSLAHLCEQGAVGDICALHYDASGRQMDIELNRRIIGIKLQDLHGMGQVIGVAGGEAKAEALLGALRGRYLGVLITDDSAARKVLALDQQ